jgi:hypothetical protein
VPGIGDAEESQWFAEWKMRADKLRILRNDVVHSVWGYDGRNPEPSAVTYDVDSRRAMKMGGMRLNTVPGGRGGVAQLATDIGDIHFELSEWTGRQLFRRLWPPAAAGLDGPLTDSG